MWVGLAAFWIIVAGIWSFHWTVSRVYVPEGKSLLLRYKGSLLFGTRKTAAAGHVCRLRARRERHARTRCAVPAATSIVRSGGNARWSRTRSSQPGEVGRRHQQPGRQPAGRQFLVDGDLGHTKYKGILRKAFGPGRYRYNPYAYEFKIYRDRETPDGGVQAKTAGWVNIPTGYVGVVTNLADNPLTEAKAGVQDKVLPPGIYPINPREQEVDIIEIGFREKSVA